MILLEDKNDEPWKRQCIKFWWNTFIKKYISLRFKKEETLNYNLSWVFVKCLCLVNVGFIRWYPILHKAHSLNWSLSSSCMVWFGFDMYAWNSQLIPTWKCHDWIDYRKKIYPLESSGETATRDWHITNSKLRWCKTQLT